MTAFPLRSVAHEDWLTLTGHLSELRTRLIVCAATLAVLFAGCLWQSRALLTVRSFAASDQAPVRVALDRSARAFSALSHSTTLTASDRQAVSSAASSLDAATRALARPAERKPITVGLGEPFSTSVTVAFAFAVALSLLLALGLIFQLPVIMLVLGRVGLLAASTLRSKRRYAIVSLACLAAALVLLRISERRRATIA